MGNQKIKDLLLLGFQMVELLKLELNRKTKNRKNYKTYKRTKKKWNNHFKK